VRPTESDKPEEAIERNLKNTTPLDLDLNFDVKGNGESNRTTGGKLKRMTKSRRKEGTEEDDKVQKKRRNKVEQKQNKVKE